MTRQALFAAAVLLPFVAVSGAYAGPTSSYPPAGTRAQSGDAYAQYVPAGHSDGTVCLYSGGPKSPIWHQHRR